MTDAVKISVAIPAYGRPAYLQALTAGVPADVSVHVSDNSSSLVGKLDGIAGNVIVVHMQEMLPIFANWNNALSLVPFESTHIVIPSDDDLFAENAFARLKTVIAAHPDIDVFIFGCDLVDEVGMLFQGYRPHQSECFKAGKGFFNFQHGVDARMPGVVFRKAFLDRIGGFDERFQLTAADSELVQRALILGRALFVPDVVAFYRVWSGGLTHSRQATDEWMQEIHWWVDKTAALMLETHGVGFGGFRPQHFKDEIVALNLLSGVNSLIARNEFTAAGAFLRRHGIPSHARLLTRLRLWRSHLRIAMAPSS